MLINTFIMSCNILCHHLRQWNVNNVTSCLPDRCQPKTNVSSKCHFDLEEKKAERIPARFGESCPHHMGYTQVGGLGLCFKRYPGMVKWKEGKKLCKLDGGELITLKTKARFQYMYSYMKQKLTHDKEYFTWVALKRKRRVSKYVWRHGGHYIGQWCPGDPTFTDEYCVVLMHCGLADVHCDQHAGTVCEVNK